MINDYTRKIELTITNLKREDYGSYTCAAENALGKAEGGIRLQGKENH